MMPTDGAPLAKLLRSLCADGSPTLICPHATGTANHAQAELAALRLAFGATIPPLLLMKPFTGHTLGASGLLDIALLAAAMGNGAIPGNMANLTQPNHIQLPSVSTNLDASHSILKIASGMGGHNAAVLLRGV
jgi:3-oxoacyl-(acyl-carrier-protein) synthase